MTAPTVCLITFTDQGRIAEIILDRSANSQHIMDAMDVVRLMLQHG